MGDRQKNVTQRVVTWGWTTSPIKYLECEHCIAALLVRYGSPVAMGLDYVPSLGLKIASYHAQSSENQWPLLLSRAKNDGNLIKWKKQHVPPANFIADIMTTPFVLTEDSQDRSIIIELKSVESENLPVISPITASCSGMNVTSSFVAC
jgi:hypothetical protein